MRLHKVVSVGLVALAFSAAAAASEPMSQAEAEAFVAPFYELLSQAGTADIAAGIEAIATPDYRSFSSNDESAGVPAADVASGLKGLATAVPDLALRPVEVIPAEGRIIVRGEATGTPVAPFFGVEPSGTSFKIMFIDIWTVTDGKVSAIHHLEDWAGAIGQLTGG